MAVKYAPSKLRVPNGFQNLLEALAREILREQPENIIQFADDYFKIKLKQRADNSVEDITKLPNKTSIETNEAKEAREEEEAAIKIQSVIRGAKARKEVNELKVSSSHNQTARGAKARKEVNELKVSSSHNQTAQTTDETTISTEGAASEADVSSSSQTGDKPPEKEEEDEEMLAAATKIQATFRGHKSRKELDDLRKTPVADETQIKTEETSDTTDISKEPLPASNVNVASENSGENEPTEEESEESAAVKIQAHFRGHKARKEVNEKRSASNDDVVANTEASDSGDINVTANAE